MPTEQQILLAVKTWAGWDTDQIELGAYNDSGKRYAFGIIGLQDGYGNDLFLQFNQVYCSEILDDSICLAAAVYALKFNVCSGWFPFVLKDTSLIPLMSSALEYLHYSNFSDSRSAQVYCNTFSECGNYSWGKIRSVGVPYTVVSHPDALTWRNRDQFILQEWPWERVRRLIFENDPPTKL